MNCLICNMDVKLDNANFVVHHIKKVHGLTSQEYYDKYFKKEGEGICLQCTNPTSFKSISAGYSIYCSKACTSRSDISKAKGKETTIRKYGVEHISQTSEFKAKLIESNKQNKDLITEGKRKSWNINKESILAKRYVTNITKFGTAHASHMELMDLTLIPLYINNS